MHIAKFDRIPYIGAVQIENVVHTEIPPLGKHDARTVAPIHICMYACIVCVCMYVCYVCIYVCTLDRLYVCTFVMYICALCIHVMYVYLHG